MLKLQLERTPGCLCVQAEFCIVLPIFSPKHSPSGGCFFRRGPQDVWSQGRLPVEDWKPHRPTSLLLAQWYCSWEELSSKHGCGELEVLWC